MRMVGFLLSGVLLWPLLAAADYESGYAAYWRGDYRSAYREWRPLAEQGDAQAQYNLGMMYESGKGVAGDSAEAVKWYRRAAERGYLEAQLRLGVMYGNGEESRRRCAGSEVVSVCRQAGERLGAAQGWVDVTMPARVLSQTTFEAAYWFRLAAEQGDAEARLMLGFMYAWGEGVLEDDAVAERWLGLAAEGGKASRRNTRWVSCTTLARLCRRTISGPRGGIGWLRSAGMWRRKAAWGLCTRRARVCRGDRVGGLRLVPQRGRSGSSACEAGRKAWLPNP